MINFENADWLPAALSEVERAGFSTVRGVLPRHVVAEADEAIRRVKARVLEVVGAERLEQAARAGGNEFRMPFVFEPYFYRFLELAPVLSVVDATLGETAILRFQNLLSSQETADTGTEPVTSHFHQNFRFQLANGRGRPVLIEVGFILGKEPMIFDVVPGSVALADPPAEDFLREHLLTLVWEPGDMFIFNPFVWHRERPGSADHPTLSVFEQFSRPFIKPHADYCRAVPGEIFSRLSPRTQRLLGWHSRLPTSMEDFYLPEPERPYRAGQW